jgi:hypothetical protein
MIRRLFAILAAMISFHSEAALAQFANPLKTKSATTQSRPGARNLNSDWVRRIIQDELAKQNSLPRSSGVAQTIQSQVTTYAPTSSYVNGYASDWTSGDCEKAIRAAEKKYNLPPYLLAAIALTESGKDGRPSPLAMNIYGQSYFARSTGEMENVVMRNGGETASIDVGCVQVNLRWHSGRFKNWRSLLVPAYNAEYAALYLRELYKERGTWTSAVGSYHSKTPWRSANYACLVSRRWSQIFGWNKPGCGADIEYMSRYMYQNYGNSR